MGVKGNSLTPSHQSDLFAETLPEADSKCFWMDLCGLVLGASLQM